MHSRSHLIGVWLQLQVGWETPFSLSYYYYTTIYTARIVSLHSQCWCIVFFRLSAHPNVWPELQQPQSSDQLWWSQQEHHICRLPWRWTLDVHGGRGLHGSHLGSEVQNSKLYLCIHHCHACFWWLILNIFNSVFCTAPLGQETYSVRGSSRSMPQSTVCACIPTRWGMIYDIVSF